jgi:DNA-binding response OmpR family regulator
LLELLLEYRGEVVPTEELMDRLDRPTANALRVNIAKLKKRLGIEIENVRGQGYFLEKV